MITKKNKLLNLICIFAAFAMFASCSLLFNDPLGEPPEIEENNITNGPRQIDLRIAPFFDVESTANYSRSAYPEFSATQLAGFTYTVTSEVLSEEVSGTYNSGQINFSINVEPFSNKTFTFYVKNSDNQIICTAQKSLSCSTIGTTINESANFSAYTGNGTDTLANGTVSLAVEHTGTNYSFYMAKVYKNPGTASEAEETAITCTNSGKSCLIYSATGGVAPGTYEFRAYVKNPDGIPFMFFKQKIEVWPGIATNKWYLSNGNKAQTYEISGTGDNILYVRGTGGSLYGSGDLPGALAASDDNAGTLLSPLASLQKAIDLCTNSAEYHIYIDGNVTGKTQINSGFKPTKLTIEGTSGNNETDILDGNKSDRVLWIANTFYHGEIILKNIKITNGLVQNSSNKDGGGIQINNGCTCKLENVWIDGNEAKGFGGGINNVGNCFIYGSTIIGSKTATTFAGSGEGQYSNIANYGGAVHNSGNLYIGYSGIGDTSQPVSDPSFSGGIYYNYAKNSGGAIYNDGGSIYFIKGNISYNTAAYYGGGVYSVKKNLNNAYLYLYGGLISNNKASISGGISNGGAVYGTSSSWVYFKASSYIPLDTDKYNTIFLESGGKIYVEETLNPPAAANGIVAYLGTSAAADAVIITAVSGVDLAAESQKFKMLGFPKIISSTGTLTYASDFYVSSAASTPAGSDTTGDGSEENPFATVTKAVALIKNTNITANYKIHISGTIKDSIVLSTGESGTLGNSFPSTLTICGTDKTSDKIDGSDNGTDAPLIYINTTKSFKFENLTICNCQSTTYAGIHVDYDDNAFVSQEITNCKIIGNLGGGIYSKSSLELKNTEITGNSGGDGAGVYLLTSGIGFDETVTITGNTNSSTSAASNVYLSHGNTFTLRTNFSNDSRIGITQNDTFINYKFNADPYTGTQTLAQTIFLSDNASRYVSLENNNLYIKNVTYAKIGDVIYYNLADTKAVIHDAASGDENTVILYSPVTTADFLEIISTIKNGSGYVNLIVDEDADIELNADCSALFAACTYLKSVDLRGCVTSGVTNMNEMFDQCSSLEKVSLKGCNTSIVTTMDFMFNGCSQLHDVDMTDCTTSNVETMKSMFKGCSNLNYLDLSMFDTSNVTNMEYMFSNCSALLNIIVGSQFTVAGIPAAIEMFTGCSNLKGGNGTVFSSTTAAMACVDTSTTPGYFTGEESLIMRTITPGANATFNGGYNISGSNVFISERSFGQMRSLIASDHEITQGEYEKYCRYLNNSNSPTNAIGKGYYYPVYYVSWYDAIIYCNLRSMDEGLDCVYSVGGKTNPAEWTGIEKSGSRLCAPASPSWTVSIDGSKNGWRLPYEVEWEYLARGGDLSQSSIQTEYSGSNNVAEVAWTISTSAVNASYMTHPVKSLAPNGCQMYDMSGNVWEWTSDFHSNKSSSPYTDQYTPISGSYDDSNGSRVTKSGGYRGGDNQSKLSNRMFSAMTERSDDLGFRIVRNIYNYIGTKTPEQTKCVGDIVFSDNSSSSYLEFQNLNSSTQEEKKAYAIAVIFYSGTGMNNGSDTTTKRTLGVGLKHNRSGIQWCTNMANAFSISIDTIKTNPYSSAFPTDPDSLRNGKNTLQLIGEFLSAPENNTSDDTTGEGARYRYPAFYYAINYKEEAQNIVGTIFENNWYLPAYAELYEIYNLRGSPIKPINIDTISELCGGDKFVVNIDDKYLCSNQNMDYTTSMYTLGYQYGYPDFNNYQKNSTIYYACAIHEF